MPTLGKSELTTSRLLKRMGQTEGFIQGQQSSSHLFPVPPGPYLKALGEIRVWFPTTL